MPYLAIDGHLPTGALSCLTPDSRITVIVQFEDGTEWSATGKVIAISAARDIQEEYWACGMTRMKPSRTTSWEVVLSGESNAPIAERIGL